MGDCNGRRCQSWHQAVALATSQVMVDANQIIGARRMSPFTIQARLSLYWLPMQLKMA